MKIYTEQDYLDAVDAMMLADADFEDNRGNTDALEFWERFERARNNYRIIRDALGKKH